MTDPRFNNISVSDFLTKIHDVDPAALPTARTVVVDQPEIGLNVSRIDANRPVDTPSPSKPKL